jgi:ubiquinone/menaquinone biosynthesis C-methylase UbiE
MSHIYSCDLRNSFPKDISKTIMSNAPQSSADLKALVESGYDHIADQYLAWSGPRPTETRAEYVQKLLGLLPSKAKVLELGCGAGVPTTQTLIAGGLDVTGVDISAAQIALAKKHIPEATLVQADMAALEYPEGSFDAVLAFYSFFHIPRAEQTAVLVKMINWLKPGGYLLFNLNTVEGDSVIDDWMGAKMFSSSLGTEGNRAMLKEGGKGLKIIADEVHVEYVGRFEEKFHWVFAIKE